VIFITALSESDDVVKGFAAGGIDYLPKPFRAKEVLARIELHLMQRQLVQQQKHLVDELSIANAAKNKVLGMAAHDLRNPLASIRALAEFLEDAATGPLNDEQRELVATIRETADGMLGLVTKLVDPAVIELGELKLELQDASVSELLAREVGLQATPAARRGIRMELADGLPAATLRFDPAKIQQVVAHILRNALRFSPPGGTIRVELEPAPQAWVISIRDQGPGMPELHRRKLALGFAQSGGSPPPGRKSSGVGLAICRRILHAHGGSLTAENLTGGGCAVRITLPAP
jgi:two-component system sensor histidine kinase/response regulator